MSVQPPWPGQFGQNPEPGFSQPPGPIFHAPKRKSVLPWVLAGAGVIVLAVMVFAAVLVAGLVEAGSKVNTAESPTLAASFRYPQGWVQTGENVTVIKEDGSKPAERFNAINRDKDATALLVYEAGAKPRKVLTQSQIHEAIDTGLKKQVNATRADLVYFRSTSGFGCVADFNYTHKPTLVERDGMYGYSYGYTCETYKGAVTGEYFVAFDDAGISHRMTVEALQTEWERNKIALTAIIDSLKPAL